MRGRYAYLAGSGAASSHSSIRSFLQRSLSCGYVRPGGGVGYVSPSRCWEVTGRGAWPSGPRRKSIEWGRASRGRWALFFEGGLCWSQGSGRRLPAFLGERTLWSGAWRLSEGVWREGGSLAAAGFISGGNTSP